MHKSYVGALLTVAFMAGLILVAHATGIVLCPLKRLTGVPCPTCGATRAVLALVHGRFVESLQINPLVVLIICALPVLWLFRFRLCTWIWAVLSVAVVCNWAYVIFRGN